MKDLSIKALAEANKVRGVEWMGHEKTLDDLLFSTTELGGEVGEALNAAKKYSRTLQGIRGGITREEFLSAMTDEIADVVICCAQVAECCGIDLAEAVVMKFNKTSDKNNLTTKL